MKKKRKYTRRKAPVRSANPSLDGLLAAAVAALAVRKNKEQAFRGAELAWRAAANAHETAVAAYETAVDKAAKDL